MTSLVCVCVHSRFPNVIFNQANRRVNIHTHSHEWMVKHLHKAVWNIFHIGLEVKPCNGEQPLLDTEGNEYDCGNGPERRDCPSHTYCHQTTRFARCCRKGEDYLFIYFFF